jgi:hypothetical protein
MTPTSHSLSKLIKLFRHDPHWVDAFEVVKDKSLLIVANPSITYLVRELEAGEIEDA